MRKTMIIFAVMLLFTHCTKKDSLNYLGDSKSNEQTQKRYEHFNYSNREQTNLELFTLAVNKALKQKEFRVKLKEQALLMFDGDYDVLFDFKKIKTHGTIEGLVYQAFINLNRNGEDNTSAFFDKLANSFPKLQISVPIHCEEWDAINYIPQVTYIPVGYDDSKDYSIKGFTSSETQVWFSKYDKPNKAVIVIGENERLHYSERNDPIGGGSGSGGSGGGNGGGNGSNSRTDGDRECVNNINFSDLNAVEPWTKGKPEIRLHVFAGSGGGQIYSGFFHPTRSSVNNAWKTYDRQMFFWTASNYGNFIIMKWIEEDNTGSTLTVTEQYTYENTTTTVSWTQKEDDDEIGGVAVGQTDPLSSVYDTGIMKWHEKN